MTNIIMTDTELVEQCIKGDQDCKKMLYEKYASTMLGVSLRYSSSLTEAEDMLQDGFIKVYRYLNKYSGNGSLEGWIRKIIVNTALNNYKRNQLWDKNIEVGEFEKTVEDSRVSNNSNLNAEQLLKLISQLPTGYKLVFNLFEIEGYSHSEIAEMLNIAESTSRTQLKKAKEKLRTQVIKLIEMEENIIEKIKYY